MGVAYSLVPVGRQPLAIQVYALYTVKPLVSSWNYGPGFLQLFLAAMQWRLRNCYLLLAKSERRLRFAELG